MVVLAAAAAMSTGPATAVYTAPEEATLHSERKVKRMRRAVASGSLAQFYRSRGPQAKPKRKANRTLIGKRVRRKHRRAA